MKIKAKNIQDVLASDSRDRLKQALDTPIPESSVKFYIGKVEDNNDPEKLGRCKVMVS